MGETNQKKKEIPHSEILKKEEQIKMESSNNFDFTPNAEHMRRYVLPHRLAEEEAANGGTTAAVVVPTTLPTSYVGFGSFHSENVEVLLCQSPEEYKVPAWPSCATVPLASASGVAVTPSTGPSFAFGKSFLQNFFVVSKEFVFVNQGAFGGALRPALDLKRDLEVQMETQNLSFFDRSLLPLIVDVTRRVASFLHTPAKNVVLVQNATAGLNAAIYHLIRPNDVVAYLDTEYLSVYKMVYYRCKTQHAALHEIPLSAHLHDDAMMRDDQRLTDHILSHLPAHCTVVVLDFITSTSALQLPIFTHLVPQLRQRGVQRIIVDGAHCPLQVELDLASYPAEALPDALIGNFHKWAACPKAAAFLWMSDAVLGQIEPMVLSHGAGEGVLSSFIWDGTRDYGAFLTLPSVLNFWESIGLTRVRSYCRELLTAAAAMLTKAFHSRPVLRHAPFLALVELPSVLQDRRDVTAKIVQDELYYLYLVECPVKQVHGRLYLRISAYVYNEPSDYGVLRESVLNIAEKFRKRPREEGTPCPEQRGCGVSIQAAKMQGFDAITAEEEDQD